MGTANSLTWCILIFVLACLYFLREFIGWTLCRQSLFIAVQTELLKYSHSTICATSGLYHAVPWRHFLWSRVEESQHELWQWVTIAGKDTYSGLKQMLKIVSKSVNLYRQCYNGDDSLFQALGSWEGKKGEREKKWGRTIKVARPQLPRAWNRLRRRWKQRWLKMSYIFFLRISRKSFSLVLFVKTEHGTKRQIRNITFETEVSPIHVYQ